MSAPLDFDPSAVRERVDAIEAVRGDDEAAHSMQDRLFADLIRSMAEGRCVDVAGCAREALRVLDMQFDRWCA